jgi:hypothetical protein
MLYHPHVHILVTAGGLHDQTWVPATRPNFLVPGRALSRLFRGKFRDALRKAGLFDQAPPAVWHKGWVVPLQHAGTGERSLSRILTMLPRSAFSFGRVAKVDR